MKTIGDTLGFHKSSVSRSVRDVSQALVNISSQFIKWPSQNEMVIIKRGFYSIAGFPAVVGAVNCTHVRIIAPSDHEPAYVNRKGYHSINTQAICNHKGKFTNIVAKWPGSNHDSFIFRESDIGAYLEQCKPECAAKIIVACAVLHNIAQDRRETINDAGCDDTQDQTDEADVLLDEVAAQSINNNIRQFIVNNYF
ncbi:putative nuclease HARBI1 [Saccostrea echinata]|uniref:putative nuclease HARBI1 n=1 Tax=Saccostrea echinata TaxID=191078 RepID=UPI002A80ABC7|nr:putative nuclease HARBI1 [Saccostrea echinata]